MGLAHADTGAALAERPQCSSVSLVDFAHSFAAAAAGEQAKWSKAWVSDWNLRAKIAAAPFGNIVAGHYPGAVTRV